MFGDDYPTPDGSCLRDYVHVCDLIDGHLLALDYLRANGKPDAFNLGIGKGFSVFEMIEAAKTVTKKPIKVEIGERRAGDPACLIASGSKARATLNWNPKYLSIEDIIADAWGWHNGKASYDK